MHYIFGIVFPIINYLLVYLLKYKKINKENKIKELIKKYAYMGKEHIFLFDTPRSITSDVCCNKSNQASDNIFYVFKGLFIY